MPKYLIWFLVCVQFTAANAFAIPKVVVSIPPIHSLVQGVMDGVGSPELLIPGNLSPHSSRLPPSVVRKMLRADLLIWIGPPLETSLIRGVERITPDRQLTLLDSPSINLFTKRPGGLWTDINNPIVKPESDSDNKKYLNVDSHIWLSSQNAAAIVNIVMDRLSIIDADNRQRYQSNADQMLARINQVHRKIRKKLRSTRDRNWLVYHDAFQYFESEFGLKSLGAISGESERPPGVKRIQLMRRNIVDRDAQCIFTEPQVQHGVISTIIEDTHGKVAILDPLGALLNPGLDLWFDLMHMIADNMIACLKEKR